jgi:hypothetical protein
MTNFARRVVNRLKMVLNVFARTSFSVSLASFELSQKVAKLAATPGRTIKDSAAPSSIAANARDLEGNKISYADNAQRRPAFPFIPIVFIHKSNSDYLKYSFGQARASNPNSSIFLLGDASNNKYDCVEHRSIVDYFEGASRFATLYKHFSTHGDEFELVCFQRWFILRDFLSANRIDKCLYLDSDTLLYANVTEDHTRFENFDFTLCWRTIGCVFFLNRLSGLDRFCKFLLDLYSGKEPYYYDRMIAHYATRLKHGLPGGVCDMTALELYNELNFGQVGEASQIIDGSVYDPNINMPHPGFEMENGIKKIMWKNDHPYGTFARTGEKIRFNSLHFNGHAKSLMGRYCTANLNDSQAPARNISVSR